jgi:hypothetical protein
MKTLLIKAVVLTDGEHYLIHGNDNTSSEEMFKATAPIWTFDPSKETAHFVELTVHVPEWEKPHVEEVKEHYHQYDGYDELTLAGPDPRMSLTLDDLKSK